LFLPSCCIVRAEGHMMVRLLLKTAVCASVGAQPRSNADEAELGPQLILENHITKRDLSQRSLSELIPWIKFHTPQRGGATAA
ncbi:MAG: hypothetical protein MUE52_17295, partial [Tabrizicola sp.]|nr:hypothetical protein [Tabrizicola sp.]